MLEALPNRLPDYEIDDSNPFKGDRLNRSQYAHILTDLIEAYSNTGCVLSINGEWGTGKTTFVKMWQSYLEMNHYRTIYFNAWETDYIDDPLIALLGELKVIIGNDDSFREVFNSVGRVLLAMGKSLAKNKFGVNVDDIANELMNQINEYSKQKASFHDFKEALKKYVSYVKEDEKLPVVFIIDELDRCNPHFAVKVLERVKHLFDIPNIIFVLPINKNQLEFSIQGFYGSEKIDAANYLRRFIDIEFELPAPDYDVFFQILSEHYRFADFYQDKIKKGNNHVRDGSDLFKCMAVNLCKYKQLDLRTMDKLFSLSRLVVTEINGSEVADLDLYFLLCYLKVCENSLYRDIKRHKMKLQQLLERIEEVIPRQLLASDDKYSIDHHSFLYAFALMLYFYNQSDSIVYEENVLPSSNNPVVNLTCSVIDKDKLEEGLKYATTRMLYLTKISDITDKIDLLRIR